MRSPGSVPRGRDYLRMLSQGRLIIISAILLSAGAAAGVQLSSTPQYVASTELFAVVAGDAGVNSAYQGDRGATTRMMTYARLVKSQVVMQRTIDELHLDTTPAALATQVSVTLGPISPISYMPTSALMGIQLTDRDPDMAVKTVNALAGNVTAVSGELYTPSANAASPPTDAGPESNLVLVDSATSARRSQGSILNSVATGAAIGLALSCLLVLARGAAQSNVLGRGQLDYLLRQTISSGKPRTV
jgi:capsular polysaccharide biosynthesis protein